jgi:glutathione synthase/RimK-type ligase-like ATP-grasp enzyme
MVPNIKLLREVCEEEGYKSELIGKQGNLVRVESEAGSSFFAYSTTPFNRESVQHICNDKFLTYELLSGEISMPYTKKYLRTDLDPKWHDVIEFSSNEQIIDDVLKSFSFPMIVKMNSGSLGRHVYKCDKKEVLPSVVQKIFEEDWAMLTQEFIEADKEFRVVIVDNKVEIAYYRGAKHLFFPGDTTFEDLRSFLLPLIGKIDLGWAGLDVIKDISGKLWLLEVNTRPSFVAVVREGKGEEIKRLYKKAFNRFL